MKKSRLGLYRLVPGLMIALFIHYAAVVAQAKDVMLVKQSVGPVAAPSAEDFAMLERTSRVSNYIARTVSSSVVHITSTKTVKSQSSGESEEDVFKHFFPNDRMPPFFRFGQPQSPEPQVGLGSGTIIDARGYIVTNNHVVEGADKIKITLPDGREFVPQWVRTDPMTDVALIKVAADDLPALELADSDKVQVGDWVMAVGNPFGLDNTVTQGIVSYIGRGVKISNSINYSNYIQTDAAINPGNSGGPLVNLYGKVIAVNSAIVSRTATFAGIGFAIPSNTIKFVISQLRKGEEVTRSYLGVQLNPDLTVPLARNFGRTDTKGALISGVNPDTPASKAGLRDGDIILGFNGMEVRNRQTLQSMVAEQQPGATVKLQIWRDKKMIEVPVTLEKMPKGFFAGKMDSGPQEETAANQVTIKELGIVISSVNQELLEKYKLKNTKGVLIVQVDPQGEGARLGLSEGDLILEAANQKIVSAKELVQVFKKNPLKSGITMHVKSVSGGSRYIYTKID
ncbi:MAG: Do family serine endopeptidase [Phycisphaerae bacterium]